MSALTAEIKEIKCEKNLHKDLTQPSDKWSPSFELELDTIDEPISNDYSTFDDSIISSEADESLSNEVPTASLTIPSKQIELYNKAVIPSNSVSDIFNQAQCLLKCNKNRHV